MTQTADLKNETKSPIVRKSQATDFASETKPPFVTLEPKKRQKCFLLTKASWQFYRYLASLLAMY